MWRFFDWQVGHRGRCKVKGKNDDISSRVDPKLNDIKGMELFN